MMHVTLFLYRGRHSGDYYASEADQEDPAYWELIGRLSFEVPEPKALPIFVAKFTPEDAP